MDWSVTVPASAGAADRDKTAETRARAAGLEICCSIGGEPSGVGAFTRRLRAADGTLTPLFRGASLFAEVGDLRAQDVSGGHMSLGRCLPPEAVGPAEIAGHPAALIVKIAKVVLSVRVSRFCGAGIPFGRCAVVLREMMPVSVHATQLHVGRDMALPGGLHVPEGPSLEILGHAPPSAPEGFRQPVLRFRIACLGQWRPDRDGGGGVALLGGGAAVLEALGKGGGGGKKGREQNGAG